MLIECFVCCDWVILGFVGDNIDVFFGWFGGFSCVIMSVFGWGIVVGLIVWMVRIWCLFIVGNMVSS